jgi:hypothetical protein
MTTMCVQSLRVMDMTLKQANAGRSQTLPVLSVLNDRDTGHVVVQVVLRIVARHHR